MNTYFFTGFPGFIARELVREMIRQKGKEINSIYLLVMDSQANAAEEEVARIKEMECGNEIAFHIVKGDITSPSLFTDPAAISRIREVDYVFHLAAIYDLAVPYRKAYEVNVKGTKHINDWLLTLPNLKRYVYFSTAYVSGKREGIIYETELDEGQKFKNDYEKTKFEAEILVEDMKDHIPVTIIRPGIVRGHSNSGATIKFDGPYFILNMFDRLSFLPVIPYLGAGKADGNFVPVDYVIQATAYLSHADCGAGKTYHLTDPAPLPMREVYRLLMLEYLGKQPVGMIPLQSATYLLNFRKLRQWVGVEKQALAYLTCRATYDTAQVQADLKDSDIVIPSFTDTLRSMVSYYRDHKEDKNKRVLIH
ncbi:MULTISPECIES: SDR family oxidoreductase [Alteribacter]|nr:SDR family oxidoreductase [Alteribacter salitolerans]MBM7094525.1 SDR family oxidoreductase [Alteribacter salitolerans]